MSIENEERLQNENTSLKRELAQALARIAQLEAQLGLDSHNSSKPPSSDGFVRSPKKRSLRTKTDKKPGGQSGHQGHSLAWNDQPNHIVEHRPSQCQECHHDLTHVQPTTWQPRQVVDLPQELKLYTVEHRVGLSECPQCHHTTRAAFPQEAPAYVQYGPHLRALAVYLNQVQLLPYARTCEVLYELFEVELSQGSLLSMLQECYEGLAPSEQTIKQALVQAETAHNDETGLYVMGRRQWLHVMSTPKLTFYAYHPKRGKAATDAIGLLPHFKGTSVHDAWSPYWGYKECQHALCNAHILRELTFVAESLGQSWAARLGQYLVSLKTRVAVAQSEGHNRLSDEEWQAVLAPYRKLIAQGLAANAPPLGGWPPSKRGRPKKPKARNLVERLQEREGEVLAFASDFKVPFDNNGAERDLRMIKVHQKVSGGFRSEAGADYFCRIRSYVSTLRKRGQSAFKALYQVFVGAPLLPGLPS